MCQFMYRILSRQLFFCRAANIRGPNSILKTDMVPQVKIIQRGAGSEVFGADPLQTSGCRFELVREYPIPPSLYH